MRLKGKVCEYAVKIGEEGEWTPLQLTNLSLWQRGSLEDPYFFLSFVKATYCGEQRRVFGNISCRAISHLPAPLIRSDENLCEVDYQFFKHNDWIYAEPGPRDDQYKKWFESLDSESPTR